MKTTAAGNPILEKHISYARKNVEKLLAGEIVRRIITYCGQRVMESVQRNEDGEREMCKLNEKHPGQYETGPFFSRYILPANGDKSKAVLHNSFLDSDDIVNHYAQSLADKNVFDFSS